MCPTGSRQPILTRAGNGVVPPEPRPYSGPVATHRPSALQLAFVATALLALSPGCSKHPVPSPAAHSQQTPAPPAPSTTARPAAPRAEAMDEERFWALVAESQTATSSCDEQASDLRGRLSRLTAEQVAGFQRIFDQKMDAAYRYDLATRGPLWRYAMDLTRRACAISRRCVRDPLPSLTRHARAAPYPNADTSDPAARGEGSPTRDRRRDPETS